MNRAKTSPIFKDKEQCVVLNGLDTENIFHPYKDESSLVLKKKLGINNEKVVLHVTPEFSSSLNNIKGGYYVLELAKRMPDVKFIVAGPVMKNVITPKNMILLGKVSDQKRLAALYSMSDVTILTSKKETFSMVTAETLSCGTPIVGFKSGAPEMIALKEYSEFVEYGDINAMHKAVLQMLSRKFDKERMAFLSKKYSKEKMTENYIKVYDKLVSKR